MVKRMEIHKSSISSVGFDSKEDIDYYEERCEDKIRSRWEEEDQRYWQNEGYRSAFEDDPDTEWNID